MRLTQADQSAVLEALRELYAETRLDRLRELIVRLSARLVGNEWASYNEITRQGGRPVHIFRMPDSVEISARAKNLVACFKAHPVMKNPAAAGPGNVRFLADYYTQREFEDTLIFNEYYRHVGVRHQMFFSLNTGRKALRAIALNRKNRGFSERDRTILNLLSPHFLQAYGNVAQWEQLRQAAEPQHQASAAPAEIILMAGTDGRIDRLSETCRQWLNRHSGLDLREGMKVPDELLRWLGHEERTRNQPEFLGGPGTPCRMIGKSGAVWVRLIAQEPDGRLILSFRSEQEPFAACTSRYSGLTSRENEVLHWITQGKNNPEIALILGMSVRTVYKHVENLFAKMGVETRAQAMVQALSSGWQSPPISGGK